jgi:hypothetical protein
MGYRDITVPQEDSSDYDLGRYIEDRKVPGFGYKMNFDQDSDEVEYKIDFQNALEAHRIRR